MAIDQNEKGIITNDNRLPPLWKSTRLTYTLCAFFAMVCHLCMRNALSFATLCMIERDAIAEKNKTVSTNDVGCVETSNTLLGFETVSRLPAGEFTWSRSQELVLLSAFYYGYLASQPIGGHLCDKYGGKIFFIFGLVAQALAFMLIPIAARWHYWVAAAMRLLQGLFAGLGVPAIYQLYTVWGHPMERTQLMGFAYSGFAVGSLIVFPVTSLLCRLGWEYVFYVIGGFCLAFGILCHWLIFSTIDKHPRISPEEYECLKETRIIKARIPPIPWRQMLTSRSILVFMLTHFCHSYGLIIIILTLPRFLQEALYFNINENGFYSATLFVSSIISKILIMFTFHRVFVMSKLTLTNFRRVVYSSGNLFTVIFFMTTTFLTCNERIVIVVLLALAGASIDVSFTGAYWVSYLDIAPAFAGLLSGISNALSTLSGIVSPLIVSQIVQEGTKAEWNHVFYMIAAPYAVSMVVYGLFGSSEPEPWGQFLPRDTV